MERGGSLLRRLSALFFNLCHSDSTESLRRIEAEIAPRRALHLSAIFTRQDLYHKVREVHERRAGLGPDQRYLVEELLQRFLRAGAALLEEERETVRGVDEELARLQTRFAQNVLGATNNYELLLKDEADLAGLPDSVRHAAAAQAREKGREGYLFTLSRSSITPFLQFADNRSLRERIYRAYTTCAGAGDAHDNLETLDRIAQLRAERARILGFESHAHFMLDERTAKSPERVMELLDSVWPRARARAEKEADDLQACIAAQGGDFRLQPWDWWYYTEKVQVDQYDLDDEDLKPYFSLEKVRDGAFEVARRLYGIRFRPVDLPVYHEDVQAYEVLEEDGTLVGIFMTDYFMRPSKRGGAWMSSFREQSKLDGAVYPIIINCCNFPPPDGETPCLLGRDEVRTLFHEFGHGLHGLLSKVTYPGQAGTNVRQDFVELPSQIMEHWAVEPVVLKHYARHYQSGEVIPGELVAKIRAAASFNQGFATTEYLAACYLDMAWHSPGDPADVAPGELERDALARIDLPATIAPRYHSSYFQHIFSGSAYSAGYYSYLWAEVLDADAFEAFREAGLFDPETAASFRRHILEMGGSEDPMELYRRFRGREPGLEPLLRKRGLA
jgi:peptidyl-dipeptidase Dcp